MHSSGNPLLGNCLVKLYQVETQVPGYLLGNDVTMILVSLNNKAFPLTHRDLSNINAGIWQQIQGKSKVLGQLTSGLELTKECRGDEGGDNQRYNHRPSQRPQLPDHPCQPRHLATQSRELVYQRKQLTFTRVCNDIHRIVLATNRTILA